MTGDSDLDEEEEDDVPLDPPVPPSAMATNSVPLAGNFGMGTPLGGDYCFPTGVSSFPGMSTLPTQFPNMYMSRMNHMAMSPFQQNLMTQSFVGGATGMPFPSLPFFSRASMMPPCTCCLSGGSTLVNGNTMGGTAFNSMGTTVNGGNNGAMWRNTMTVNNMNGTGMWQQPQQTHRRSMMDPPTSPTSVACEVKCLEDMAPKLPLAVQGADNNFAFGLRLSTEY